MTRPAIEILILLAACVALVALAYSCCAYDLGYWLGTLTR